MGVPCFPAAYTLGTVMPMAVFSPQLQAGAEREVSRTVFLVSYGGRDQRQRSQRRRERMGDLERERRAGRR